VVYGQAHSRPHRRPRYMMRLGRHLINNLSLVLNRKYNVAHHANSQVKVTFKSHMRGTVSKCATVNISPKSPRQNSSRQSVDLLHCMEILTRMKIMGIFLRKHVLFAQTPNTTPITSAPDPLIQAPPHPSQPTTHSHHPASSPLQATHPHQPPTRAKAPPRPPL
jgi:hypothetical protein